jgi:CheY-like chemotaxis protein
VSDTGIGITEDMIGRVFDMFTQVDAARDRSQGGLGIGLNLSQRLVDMHGGTIAAKSEGAGHGSTFTIELPLAPAATRAKLPLASETAHAHSTPLRILVVDDNIDAADSMAMLLQFGGHETRIANDGVQAVSTAEAFRPDVILLDIGLPRMNGHEAAAEIRRQPWAEHTALIAMSGWGQDADRQRSREAGFDHHLVKPVDHNVLKHLLAAVEPAQSQRPA